MKKFFFVLYIIFFGITTLHAIPHLIGTWTATVENNRSFDTFRITFTANGRCTVKVNNENADQETSGNWSWDGSLFRLNAVFRNAKLSYLPNIQWTSVLNFSADNNSFTILEKTAANGSQTRITFFRTDDTYDITFNEKIIHQIFNALSADIPQRSRLAIVSITSSDPNEGNYYLNELTLHFVNSRRFTVVDRSDIDKILAEQDFQMSGLVDDNAFVSIGKFFGANVVVTGSITGTGSQKRMVIKVIDVLTSEILAMESVSL